jgi:hypothetical protein
MQDYDIAAWIFLPNGNQKRQREPATRSGNQKRQNAGEKFG